MTQVNCRSGAADGIGKHVPFLRRYGRALSGNQADGDSIAAATLNSVLQASSIFDRDIEPKVALFSVFQRIWVQSMADIFVDEDGDLAKQAQAHLAKLGSGSRDALLLNSLEQFSIEDISTIMRTDPSHVRQLLDEAYNDMAHSVTGRVLIIEDDAIIANEIDTIVSSMGHRVTGSADTHAAAVDMAHQHEPDLILADILLADDTSGIEATEEILTTYKDKPVVFITGHPEILLTGEKPEPTFLIPKPFLKDQVRTAVSQALFFRSTDALNELNES